jgi:high-affinity nickel-transport protein
VANSTRRKIVAIYALLIGANVAVWIAAFLLFAPGHAVLLGTALLAYTFGLRHAVDADHISAIDNVTRKLMQDGKREVAVGFFFSLGHSTIVVALTVLIALGAGAVKAHLPNLEGVGGIAGTAISAAFLFLIAAINGFVLVDVLRRGRTAPGGLLGRIFKPLLRLVSSSRDMYLVGVLFGLGFDTATEVGLLGIAAIEAGRGLPIWSILIFPALFTAGMSLVDTTDGVLMLGAYGWAFVNPARKLYYNVTVTSVSILVALLVGGFELWSIARGTPIAGWLGFAIVAAFALIWGASALLHAARGYGRAGPPAGVESAVSNGVIPSARSQASKCFTYALPNESASARTYDS